MHYVVAGWTLVGAGRLLRGRLTEPQNLMTTTWSLADSAPQSSPGRPRS
jgi:hypothetical protein